MKFGNVLEELQCGMSSIHKVVFASQTREGDRSLGYLTSVEGCIIDQFQLVLLHIMEVFFIDFSVHV